MTTDEIADALRLTAQLMELHDENSFKARALSNAAFKLSKTGIDLQGRSLEELEKIEGIGKGIASKIFELQSSGELKDLNTLLVKTPVGVIEMLRVKGIGPKKVALLWKELGVETIGELLYACNENRLIALKGFGDKTQESVKKSIEFILAHKGKFLYANVEEYAVKLVEELKIKYGTDKVSLTGKMRRKCEVIETAEMLVGKKVQDGPLKLPGPVPAEILFCEEKDFYRELFETTGAPDFLSHLSPLTSPSYSSEEEIFSQNKLQFIAPELREDGSVIALAQKNKIPALIEVPDLKGILHNHTNYSDGLHSLREMAEYCKQLGYEYLGICDHSQTAAYAGGLKPEKVLEQQKEIDALNRELAPFRIFKGIESDILGDGSLDYPEEILGTFDLVVASVHSNLKMPLEKAMSRLMKAIENPYTTILGHPTGRLLLSREGYPVDHKKIIDACAANGVVIELNAHPHRLDIDWRWIPYCMERGVKISINPDAHEKEGYHDMYFGVCAARKGMLTKEHCFNALTLKEIEKHFRSRKK